MFELRSIYKAYQTSPDAPLAVLKDLSLSAHRGEILGLIGLSGAGKSTALRTFNLLEVPDRGHVYFQDQELSTRNFSELRRARQKIGMIFQHFNLISNKTVADNVAFPLTIAGWEKHLIQKRVAECLELVRLSDKAKVYPNQLSGGQKQRVAIARSIANHPDLLLADEPTSALDPITKIEILDCLSRINRDFGLTIIIATHEMNIVRRLCHRVAILDDGKILELLPISNHQLQPQPHWVVRFWRSHEFHRLCLLSRTLEGLLGNSPDAGNWFVDSPAFWRSSRNLSISVETGRSA